MWLIFPIKNVLENHATASIQESLRQCWTSMNKRNLTCHMARNNSRLTSLRGFRFARNIAICQNYSLSSWQDVNRLSCSYDKLAITITVCLISAWIKCVAYRKIQRSDKLSSSGQTKSSAFNTHLLTLDWVVLYGSWTCANFFSESSKTYKYHIDMRCQFWMQFKRFSIYHFKPREVQSDIYATGTDIHVPLAWNEQMKQMGNLNILFFLDWWEKTLIDERKSWV